MKNISQRIKIIAENEGIKITQLENKIGASKGVLSRSLSNNTDIQSKWLTFIVDNYPRYNSEWLLTGKGAMLKSNEILEYNKSILNSTCPICTEKDKRIEHLEHQIEQLEHQIERNEKDIDWLRSQINKPEETTSKRRSA